MMKLKFQHFGYLMRRANSLGKTPMLGKIKGKRRKGRQMMINRQILGSLPQIF